MYPWSFDILWGEPQISHCDGFGLVGGGGLWRALYFLLHCKQSRGVFEAGFFLNSEMGLSSLHV